VLFWIDKIQFNSAIIFNKQLNLLMKRFLLFSFITLYSFSDSFSQTSGNVDLGSEITNGIMTDGCVSSCQPTYCTNQSDNGGNHPVETMVLTITGVPANRSVEIVITSIICGGFSGLDGGDDIFIDGVQVFTGAGNAAVDLTECVVGGADIVIEFTANRRDEVINVTWDSGPTDPGAACFMPIVPVEFGIVEARTKQNNKVELMWETHTEINNAYFDVQWSRDGTHFQSIGDVEGAGNATEKISYSLVHENPKSGQNLYRIKQVDFDGSFAYSNLVSTRVEKEGSDIALTPSPVRDELYISSDKVISLKVYSLSGALVLKQNNIRNNLVDVSELQSGVYVVRMQTLSNSYSKKIIKQ